VWWIVATVVAGCIGLVIITRLRHKKGHQMATSKGRPTSTASCEADISNWQPEHIISASKQSASKNSASKRANVFSDVGSITVLPSRNVKQRVRRTSRTLFERMDDDDEFDKGQVKLDFDDGEAVYELAAESQNAESSTSVDGPITSTPRSVIVAMDRRLRVPLLPHVVTSPGPHDDDFEWPSDHSFTDLGEVDASMMSDKQLSSEV
jgi:hypothetical protein